MNTEEIAKKVVELVRKQAWHEALDALYADDVVSVEATAPESRSYAGELPCASCAKSRYQSRVVRGHSAAIVIGHRPQ